MGTSRIKQAISSAAMQRCLMNLGPDAESRSSNEQWMDEELSVWKESQGLLVSENRFCRTAMTNRVLQELEPLLQKEVTQVA
jgi:hypothetical protein